MADQVKLLKQKLLEEIDPLARAAILKNLHTHLGVPTKDLAKLMKVSEPYISSMMRLLKLPELVIDGYYSKIIKLTHLLVISRLDEEEQMKKAYEEVLMKSLSTQATDDLVRTYKYSISADVSGHIKPNTVEALHDAIKKIDPEARVKVIQTRIRAKLVIEKSGEMGSTTKLFEKLEKKLTG